MQEMGPSDQQGPGQATSSIQRLKDQRNLAQQEVQDLRSQLTALQAQVAGLSEQPKTSPTGYVKPDQWPIEELESFVTSQQTIDENPQLANQAIVLLINRKLKDLENKVLEKANENLRGTVKQYTESNKQWAEIQREFGPDAVDKNSSLYQEADSVYARLKQQYARKQGPNGQIIYEDLPPAYLRLAFMEARNNLGSQPESAAFESAVNKPQGPSPNQRIEGTSDGTADALATRKQAIEGGNLKSVFSGIAQELYSGG
jgi:cell division septum initiation protein DivIVA